MRTRLVLITALIGSFVALPLSGAATTTPARAYGTTWVVSSAGNTLLAYGPNALGAAKPTAKIRGTATGLHAPSAVAVSATGNLFVTNAGNNSITEYAPAADGNAAPIATIAGSQTGLDAPSSLTLSDGAIWVTNPESNVVESFTEGESGNVLPAETIAGHKTKLNHPVALTVNTSDVFGTTIVVVNNPPQGNPTLTVYAKPKRGDVAPSVVTRGPKGHRLVSPVAIDQAGLDQYAVADAGNNSVVGLDIEALVPLRGPTLAYVRRTGVIAGSKTGIDQPQGVSHDAFNRVVVANGSDHTVRVFAAGANGNVQPQRIVSGVGTASGSPSAATVSGVAPGTPTHVKVQRHGNSVNMSWQPPTFTGGGVAGYSVFAVRGRAHLRILRAIGFLDFFGVSTPQTSFAEHIKPGHRYSFAVATVNGFGVSHFSHPVTVAHVIAPTPPRRVKALAGRHSLLVKWKPSKADGGAQVHYVERYAPGCRPGTKGCKAHKVVATRFTEGALPIRGLKRHTTYDVEVVARNKAGASPSRVVQATTN